VAGTEVERASGVDTADVPSANWGWSRINYRTWYITGFIIFVFLLCMLRGNHVGHIEDWFLIGFAALVLFVLVRDLWGRRRGWIR
jgi:amino acid permease